MTDWLSAARPTPGVAPCQPLLPAGGAPCRAMLSYIHRSRRQNVGSLADSEGDGPCAQRTHPHCRHLVVPLAGIEPATPSLAESRRACLAAVGCVRTCCAVRGPSPATCFAMLTRAWSWSGRDAGLNRVEQQRPACPSHPRPRAATQRACRGARAAASVAASPRPRWPRRRP